MCAQNESQLTNSWQEELTIRQHLVGNTSVKFLKPSEIEGSEFAVVLVLINFKQIADIAINVDSLFFTSITRATIKLTILINEDQVSEYRLNYELDSFAELRKDFSKIRRGDALKPHYLLIGPKKPTTSDFLSGDHQLTAGSSVFHLSLYIGKEGGSFLYCQDVFKESHISMLYEMGIRKAVLFNYFFAFPFYELTLRMIHLFSKKKIKIKYVSAIQSLYGLSRIIDFCSEYCKDYQPEKSASQIRKQYNDFDKMLTADMMSFNWSLVGKKAIEAEREQLTWVAFGAYWLWLRFLGEETHPINEKCLPVENRYKRAEVSSKLSLSSMEATEQDFKSFDFVEFKSITLGLPVYTPHEFLYFVIIAINTALQSIVLNALWEEGYEAFTPAMGELGKYFQEEKKKYEEMTTETSRDLAIAELVRNDKDNKELTEFFTKLSQYPNDSTYKDGIKNYKEQFISATEKILVASRKTLSLFALKLSKEKLYQACHSRDGANNKEIVLKTVSKLHFTNYPLRLAIEAWQWNPTDPEIYQVIFDAMKLVEKQVDIIYRNVHLFDDYEEYMALTEVN